MRSSPKTTVLQNPTRTDETPKEKGTEKECVCEKVGRRLTSRLPIPLKPERNLEDRCLRDGKERLDLLDRGSQALESSLVLKASLTGPVAEVVGFPGCCFWFRSRFRDGFGNSLGCALHFEARFAGAVAEVMNSA